MSFDKIKSQDYFAEFSWSDLLEERVLPPYTPKDFKGSQTQHVDSTGDKFLRHLYGSRNFGRVENWDESKGI